MWSWLLICDLSFTASDRLKYNEYTFKGNLTFPVMQNHRAAIKITKYPEGKGRRMSGRKKEVRVVVEYKKD